MRQFSGGGFNCFGGAQKGRALKLRMTLQQIRLADKQMHRYRYSNSYRLKIQIQAKDTATHRDTVADTD